MVVTGEVTGDVDVDSVVTIIWVGLIGLVVSDGLTSGACVVITSRKVISGPIGSLYDLIVVKMDSILDRLQSLRPKMV